MNRNTRPRFSRLLLLHIPPLMLCALLIAVLSACTGGFSAEAVSARTASTAISGKNADEEATGAPAQKEPIEQASSAHTVSSADQPASVLRQDALKKQAEEVSALYGVKILYGEDVPLSFADYTVKHLAAPGPVREALETLADTLALYPPTFFPSVCEDFCDTVTICLAKDLQAVNGDVHMEYVNAFTTVQDGTIWLVLDAQNAIRSSTLIHEITHVTDYRLLGMQQLRESEWNQLNPPGFAYYDAYLDDAGRDLRISGSGEYTSQTEEDPSRIYFHDSYSRTYAMEDRARLMESLFESDLSGIPDPCFSSPHVQTKLRFYFYTLRQAFANGRWPEETAWEAAFRRAVSGEN